MHLEITSLNPSSNCLSYGKAFLRYLGYYLTLKFTFKLMSKFYFFFSFMNRGENFNFPNQINFIQNKNVNWVLINWNALKYSDKFCLQFIQKGYKVVLLIKREEKEEAKGIKQKLNKMENKILIKSYRNNYNSIKEFSDVINRKLFEFNHGNNHIKIFVNNINSCKENLNEYFDLLKKCISQMLIQRGKSIIIGVAEKGKDYMHYKLAKKFHNQIKIEYMSKIEIVFIKIHNKNLNLELLQNLNIEKLNMSKKNYNLFNTWKQLMIYYLKKLII